MDVLLGRRKLRRPSAAILIAALAAAVFASCKPGERTITITEGYFSGVGETMRLVIDCDDPYFDQSYLPKTITNTLSLEDDLVILDFYDGDFGLSDSVKPDHGESVALMVDTSLAIGTFWGNFFYGPPSFAYYFGDTQAASVLVYNHFYVKTPAFDPAATMVSLGFEAEEASSTNLPYPNQLNRVECHPSDKERYNGQPVIEVKEKETWTSRYLTSDGALETEKTIFDEEIFFLPGVILDLSGYTVE